MKCAECKKRNICYQGEDCTKNYRVQTQKAYEDPLTQKMHGLATRLEAEHYMQWTRLEELIAFSQEMGYEKLGIAFCVGFNREAELLSRVLKNSSFKVSSVCCKVCGIDKKDFDLPQVQEGRYEAICNPVGQAAIFNDDKTDLNIILGLCLGHDIIFTQNSQAPVTTFAVKDRVLAHNPLGALYSGYYLKKRFGIDPNLKPGPKL